MNERKQGHIKKVLFSLLIVALLIPYLQSNLHIFNSRPLKGAIKDPENTEFSFEKWFSGEYQQQKEHYLNSSFGLRPTFIRINNQIAYSLFNIAKANQVIVGKNNCLYEKNYIDSYLGINFVGRDSINHRFQRLNYLRDTLKKLNKDLLIVFAPGKASFFPENIPGKYPKKQGISNYEYSVKKAADYNLNYIDFNKWFIEAKDTSTIPLYSKLGIHWSVYGTLLAGDSIIRYIEKMRNIDMVNLHLGQLKFEETNSEDQDIAEGMNLLFSPPKEQMAYPEYFYDPDSGKVKPRVLIISDSYYWLLYGHDFSKTFSNTSFWFYNNSVNTPGLPEQRTLNLNLNQELAKYDIIILLATEATVGSLGWGFIEEAYAYLNPGDTRFQNILLNKKIQQKKEGIRTNPEWMKQIEFKAHDRNISVDSMLTIDALWLISNNK